ncbi:peptidylprolyl isomerase [Planktotalea sp.]|uniref:peptidylprolyl isomerase n=1 Tax=Planktotalea sp. TaxID=2029877 RepID=UPI003299521E
MRKLAAAFALMASPVLVTPALATGLQIEVAGEGANGTITIDLLEDLAPNHAARLAELAAEGAYNGVVFHRVIEGFMAQTGDVEHGKEGGNLRRAGTGGSDKPDLAAEFTSEPFKRGIVGMARSQNPNSANSQFFIMFDDGEFLNNQYTVVGRVTGGMDIVDQIKLGTGGNGAVVGAPDVMKTVTVTE